jgi:predicted PurR-regulated permease PerM
MSDLSVPPTSPNGIDTSLFWQRITNQQVVIGTVLVALVLLGLGLIVALRYVFLMLFLGIVMATALTPVVDRLRKFGLAQSTATLIAFSALLLIIGGIVAALAPFFVVQFVQALTDLPKFYAGFRTTISSSNAQFLRGLGAQLPADLFSGLAGDNGIALGSQITLLLPALVSTLLFSTLVIILSYYWLFYRALAIQSIALLVPINQRAGAIELWNEIETKIGAFVRGLAILGFVIGLLSAIGYVAIGLPYGLTIAIIAGILEAIPYVGPLITVVLAGLVGLSVSQPMALLAISIAMVIQFLENTIVVPRVMDRAVGVSPVVTLLALAVFSDLFGLLGALLAVPLAAVFQVLLDRVMLRAVSPADLEIGGRDKLALLRYQTQDLANDLRQQVRSKPEDMDVDADAAEEELEALLLDLDSLLAAAQEQRV